MSLQSFFQLGYVTRDIDKAIAATGRSLHDARFSTLDVTLALATPEGERSMQLRVATAWDGPVQIELIQPVAGHVAAYASALPLDPNDATPQFHHLAVRRDDASSMRAEVERLGLPIAFETGGSGFSVVFVDARSIVGHYLEFVCATPEAWAMIGPAAQLLPHHT